MEVVLLDLLWTSSSEEEEDDILKFLEQRKQPKIKRFIEDVVHQLNDKEFKSHFRVLKDTADHLISRYESSRFYNITVDHGGSTPISAEKHMLLFLWFAGNKCCLRDLMQRFDVSVSTAHKAIEQVCDFLIEIAPELIKFSKTEEEKYEIAREFQKISGFPNVIGCVDGSSINIITPAKKIKSTYCNRHDLPSVTLQGICDFEKKFIDVFTGPPGKIHDSRVWKLSKISKTIPGICKGKYHLLGDGAYSIRKWLLTPYKDFGNLGLRERTYNKKFSVTRVCIENAFGILKNRFRQLQQLHFHKVDKITKFIIACCVLHNLCITRKDLFETEVVIEDGDVDEEPETETVLRRQGEMKRNVIRDSLLYM